MVCKEDSGISLAEQCLCKSPIRLLVLQAFHRMFHRQGRKAEERRINSIEGMVAIGIKIGEGNTCVKERIKNWSKMICISEACHVLCRHPFHQYKNYIVSLWLP